MNNYHIITAKIDGQIEELFGSFDRTDCKYELEANKESWKDEGYKAIKISTKQVASEPSKEIYTNAITAKQLFQQQAPNFNFELDEQQLVEVALERGFVTKIGEDMYIINEEY